MPETDVATMKVADLKRELKLRQLPTTGNKTELQDRLQTALIDGELSLEDTAISGEDIDIDEDAVLTDEEEAKILGADENELLKSPVATPTTAPDLTATLKSTAEPEDDEDDILNTSTSTTGTTASASKKIVLKRRSSFTTTANAVSTPAPSEPLPPAKALKMSERNPIVIEDNSTSTKKDEDKASSATVKVSQLSLQERLELRAKKFGLAASTTAATADGVATAAVGSGVNDEKQIEMLKKRAERFGCVVSPKIAQLDANEKLLKRKERFGGATTTKSGGAGSDVWAEKARLRLERFKTATSAGATEAATPVPAAAAADNGN